MSIAVGRMRGKLRRVVEAVYWKTVPVAKHGVLSHPPVTARAQSATVHTVAGCSLHSPTRSEFDQRLRTGPGLGDFTAGLQQADTRPRESEGDGVPYLHDADLLGNGRQGRTELTHVKVGGLFCSCQESVPLC